MATIDFNDATFRHFWRIRKGLPQSFELHFEIADVLERIRSKGLHPVLYDHPCFILESPFPVFVEAYITSFTDPVEGRNRRIN